MSTGAWFAVGAALGFAAAALLMNTSACCTTVAHGVRDKVADKLGSGAVAIGDALGAWGPLGGLVSTLGLS